jgi:ketosteroid isomerase-like protein
MTALVRVAIALCAVAAGACTRHGEVAAPAPIEGAADIAGAAKGTLEKWRQAYEVRSVEGLAALYAHDESVVLVQGGAATIGWKAIEPLLKERLAKVTVVRVRLKDVVAAPLGADAAVVTAVMTRELGDATTTLTEAGTVSLVMRHVGTAWVIVHEHFSYKRPS